MLPTPLVPVLVMLLRLTKPAVIKLPPVMLPDTLSALNVPTDVILGCAAVVTVPAVVALVADPAEVAKVALATVPVTLAPVILLSPEPLPLMFAPVILPLELNDVNVPTLVILGCAAVVTVPAVVALVAEDTVPVTLPPGIDVSPTPFPINWPLVCIFPEAVIKPVMYCPVVAHTTTFEVPPTPTDILPPELTTVTLLLPKLMLATDVITPVSSAPLPRM
jgi:hypothetical protein